MFAFGTVVTVAASCALNTQAQFPTPTTACPWKRAIEDAYELNHIDFYPKDPVKSLANLIQWEVKVALDPRVSSAARQLARRAHPRIQTEEQRMNKEQTIASLRRTTKRLHEYPSLPGGRQR